MSKCFVIVLLFASIVYGHDTYSGKCPKFQAMSGFDWNKFKREPWYAVEKFGTNQAKCVTYDFQEDEFGFREIVQNSENTFVERLSFDNNLRYVGKLAAVSASNPADMIVRFQLNPFGPASFVILDTDYENSALLCTCQDKKFFFDFLTFHRRSCTILQRKPMRDTSITSRFHDLVNQQIESNASHDFDVISHEGCSYDEPGKGLQVDVEKVVGKIFGTAEDDYIIDGDYQAEVVEFTTKQKGTEGSGREDDSINEI